MTSPTSSEPRAAPRRARRRDRRTGLRAAVRHGFTLVEMLVVLSIVGVLMGISVAAFRRSIPHREIARRAVFDALVQARLFSVAENAPATVSLDPGDEATRWASV